MGIFTEQSASSFNSKICVNVFHRDKLVYNFSFIDKHVFFATGQKSLYGIIVRQSLAQIIMKAKQRYGRQKTIKQIAYYSFGSVLPSSVQS